MKILVVEDERRIANYIKKGLENNNMVVDVAYDGEEGYDLASGEEYDVIVLDIMLPHMDGVEITKKLRDEGKQTPILMLTAKGALGDKVEGFEAGADDYLPKPFAFVELIARIKALGRRPRNGTSSVLKVGDLMLDTNTYEVARSGEKIELSRKEFTLLEFLMRNAGRVFDKDKLTELVWSYESEVLPNTAQVYVGYLRKKVDGAFPHKKPLIRTVRGFGYKIDDN